MLSESIKPSKMLRPIVKSKERGIGGSRDTLVVLVLLPAVDSFICGEARGEDEEDEDEVVEEEDEEEEDDSRSEEPITP